MVLAIQLVPAENVLPRYHSQTAAYKKHLDGL